MGVSINSLPGSSIPYDGTEVLPLVQSGATKKASLASLITYLSTASLYANTELNALSGNWQSSYTSLYSLSSNWQNSSNTVKGLSGRWSNAYNTVNTLSGEWDSVYNTVSSLSGSWNSTFNTLYNLSGTWNTLNTNYNAYSPAWESNYTNNKNLSSNWNSSYSTVGLLSSNWNSTYNTVNSLSSVHTTVNSLSNNWESNYTNNKNLSGNWNSVYNQVNSLSSNWSSVYSTGSSISSVYTTVNSLSDKWESAYSISSACQNALSTFATIEYTHSNFLPLTGGIITGNTEVKFGNLTVYGNISASGALTFTNTYVSSTSSLSVISNSPYPIPGLFVSQAGTGDIATFYDVSSDKEVFHIGGSVGYPGVGVNTSFPNKAFTVVGDISATGVITASGSDIDINVITDNTSRVFTNEDNNKVIHLDTTISSLCAIFPDTLRVGFNVAIMNIGLNNLVLSAAQLNSIGTSITTRFGGAFIYKDSTSLFAVGRLI